MKILKKNDNLAFVLKSLRNQKITIISAFASGTEDVVDSLLQNNNNLELIIGTINSFSSPNFFDHCISRYGKKLSLIVDFNYQNSIHWKLYLIEPSTVIIGSANFTKTGLNLFRDTCVVIEDKLLLNSYKEQVESIKASDNVIGYRQKQFSHHLQKYRSIHRRMQAGLARTTQVSNGLEWLEEETNQLIPLFIWDSIHSKDTIKKAHELLDENDPEESKSEIRDFFTYSTNEGELPYEQGDVVLCLKNTGAYIDFYSFDRIIYKDGMNYIYSFKRKRYLRPFRLDSEIKNEIKKRVGGWYDSELTELDRSKIISLYKY